MAKLGYYYGLCPLIDERNLQGVCEDVEAGCAIVTLGTKIAIKYRLSDQKQLHSWRTKDKFSSPVIFDVDIQKYVAVFNQTYIRMWGGDEEYLDKLKKYKFKKHIYTLITCAKKTYVVFKNSEVVTLSSALNDRKDFQKDREDNSDLIILAASLRNDVYIGILSQSEEKWLFMCNIFNEDEKKLVEIELVATKNDAVLVGQVLTQLDDKNTVYLITLWSDGKLFSYPVCSSDDGANKLIPPGEMFALVESLSCKHPVTIVSLSSHYITMYGADLADEGATLILFNTQFKVSQSKQALKLFTPGSRLWKIENNLLFCLGRNLAVISFHFDTEKLSTLVGSHRNNVTDSDIIIIEQMFVVNWKSDDLCELDFKSIPRSIPNLIKKQVLKYSNEGICEALICEKIVTQYLENNDVTSVICCLDYFCDVPEYVLSKILYFALNIDVSPQALQLLDKILLCSFSDVLLLPYIHNELDLRDSLHLLDYISNLLSEDGRTLPGENSVIENKLLKWSCLILDANYQKFLLSKDEKVMEVLNKCNTVVCNCLTNIRKMDEVLPLLNRLRKDKSLTQIIKDNRVDYKILNEFIF